MNTIVRELVGEHWNGSFTLPSVSLFGPPAPVTFVRNDNNIV